MSVLKSLSRTKPVESLADEGERTSLHRGMGLVPLIALSVGATLGTGIFVVLGQAAPKAGPAVAVSFVVAALAALFSALSYAELAGAVPVSGSAYSYTYATLGELVAWVCGWCLLLEYGVSVAAVAVGWSGYLNAFLDSTIGVQLPAALSNAPGVDGGVVNLPAAVVVLLATAVLLGGIRESSAVTTAATALKVLVLAFFVVVAVFGVRSGNLTPFAPAGVAGITGAASLVFFSFIGFDAASTAGEEAKNPQRDLPRAIVISLAIVTVAYVLVAITAVGAVGVDVLSASNASLSTVLLQVTGANWPSTVLSAGAVIAIASVVLTVLYGQTRVLVAMSRDGLVPGLFSRIGKRRVPTANTLVVGCVVAVLAALVPLGQLAEATSIGTLVAFGLVNIGVVVLRRKRPDLPRTFRTPLMPLVPALGLGLCLLLAFGLAKVTWVAFGIWSVAGLVVYFGYGRRRSALARGE